MATIKSYTDLEQSKKLAEILSLESADIRYQARYDNKNNLKYIPVFVSTIIPLKADIPCWSLATLLNVLPKIINNETLFIETSAALWHIGYRNIYTARADNPVDACVAMIEKLHEFNLL